MESFSKHVLSIERLGQCMWDHRCWQCLLQSDLFKSRIELPRVAQAGNSASPPWIGIKCSNGQRSQMLPRTFRISKTARDRLPISDRRFYLFIHLFSGIPWWALCLEPVSLQTGRKRLAPSPFLPHVFSNIKGSSNLYLGHIDC